MTPIKRIYLAGPEVFLPSAQHQAIVTEKKRILELAGFAGVDPLDTDLEFSDGQAKALKGQAIYRANRQLMDSCDGIIANLTPFRGLSADPGTVFEVGYMIGQHKPAAGFSLDGRSYYERAGCQPEDAQGNTVEDFDLSDNLMIECGIIDAGGQLITGSAAADRWFEPELFQRCVTSLTDQFD